MAVEMSQPVVDRCVRFLQRLIQTPSLPGQEGDLAALVAAEMQEIGYDRVEVDEVGNVLGVIRGRGAAPPLMFNTHLDHVDVGDQEAWPYPPFAAEIHDDRVWGRGRWTSRVRWRLKSMEWVRLSPRAPPGDVWVTGVVQEEIGGVGARHLAERHQFPVVVVGEPSR